MGMVSEEGRYLVHTHAHARDKVEGDASDAMTLCWKYNSEAPKVWSITGGP